MTRIARIRNEITKLNGSPDIKYWAEANPNNKNLVRYKIDNSSDCLTPNLREQLITIFNQWPDVHQAYMSKIYKPPFDSYSHSCPRPKSHMMVVFHR